MNASPALGAEESHGSPWARRAGALAFSLAQAALDTLYPPTCLACRTATDRHGALCPRCWNTMRFIERPFCERLGTPFEHDLGQGLISPQAMADPPAFGRARAVARFEDGPARTLVHRLKYSDRAELCRPIAAWMTRAGADILADADLLTPVPLHALRLWRRQFNQAAALAREISRQTGKPCDLSILRRVKATSSQVGLSRAQRAENVQGAFRAAEGATVRGLNVVLIDDVLTSGATANASARALLRVGAKRVDVLVFARVVTAA
ncbi:MAG TPA: ComF family protein [Roseiarcus sp.]|nr:ComF family protein [Roseiarcus sp.]